MVFLGSAFVHAAVEGGFARVHTHAAYEAAASGDRLLTIGTSQSKKERTFASNSAGLGLGDLPLVCDVVVAQDAGHALAPYSAA